MVGRLPFGLRSMVFGLVPLILQIPPIQAAELVMFESKVCEWCDAWHAEIGPIYPKTDEGKRAPLRKVDIHDHRPPDLDAIESVRFTPTFVLLDDDGQEVGRINGYPGEDFFWGLLSELIAKLPAEPEPMTEARNEGPKGLDARSYSILTEYNS